VFMVDQRRLLLLLVKKKILKRIKNMANCHVSLSRVQPEKYLPKLLRNYGQKAVEKIVKIAEAVEGHPELKEIVDKLDSGRKRLECAHSEIMRALDRDKPKPTPPTGKYEVLLVDPPWSYENSSVRGSPENHYAVLTNEELMQLALPAAENAVLFVWVPYPKTREAFDILDCWGFEYKSEIIWVKDKIGTGYYTRGKHEKLFICVKGDGLGVPAEQDRPESAVYAERTEHSKKPLIFYEIIERMYPNHTRIELFARGEEAIREGWAKPWGDQAPPPKSGQIKEEGEEEEDEDIKPIVV
jgi:N6-adenosine-specific RNA methylase IME4